MTDAERLVAGQAPDGPIDEDALQEAAFSISVDEIFDPEFQLTTYVFVDGSGLRFTPKGVEKLSAEQVKAL